MDYMAWFSQGVLVQYVQMHFCFFLLEQQFSCYSIANQLFNTFKEEKVVGNNIQNCMSTISDLHLAVVQVD